MTNTGETFATFRESFFSLAQEAQHVVITAHFSPDDDSIASVLSVYTILSKKYPAKDIRIVYTGERSDRHSIFLNFEHIEWVDDVANHLEGTDLLVILDVNRLVRISKTPEVITSLKIPHMVAIDHHGTAPDPMTLTMVDPSFSSNAELIYRALDAESVLTKELAELFLLGILGDTGNFSHLSPQQTDVFLIAKVLIEKIGVSIDKFRSQYGGIPRRIIPLLQELVQHTDYVSIEGWPPMQYTYIQGRGEYSDEDMSAASHIYMGQYLPRVEGYPWGVVVTPRSDGSIRISARSLPGGVNVRDLFEQMSIGGGHDRAAGAYMKDVDPEKGLQTLMEWIKTHKPAIV